MNYRLGLYEKAMPIKLSWREKLEAAKAAGFDFVEISIDETDRKLARLDWDDAEINKFNSLKAEVGISVDTMCLSGHRKYPLGSRDPETRKRGVEIFHKAVDFAHKTGIRLIQLAGYDVYYEEGSNDTARMFAENLALCVRYAAQNGIILGFETMETPFMDNVSKAMKYVHLINSPYLGVYPDLGNLTNACIKYGDDVINELEAGRGHIFAMHIKETKPGTYRDMHFGDGHVKFEEGIAKARELGICLFVSECWDDGNPDWQGVINGVNTFVRSKFS